MVCHVSTTKLTPRVSLCCIDNIEYKVVDLSVQISREAPFMGLNLIKRAEDGLHHHKQTITKWHFKPFPWLGHTQTNWTIEGRGLVKLPFLPHTLYLKCLSGHSSVCYKTTLNTGQSCPSYFQIEDVFVMALGSKYVDLWSFGRSSETFRPPIFEAKYGSGSFRVSPKAPFIRKLL